MRDLTAAAVLACLLLLLAGGKAAAQPGTVSGQVREAGSAGPLGGVRVEIRAPSGQIIAGGVTNAEGRFRIGNVGSGSYSIRLTHLGFAPHEATLSVAGGAVSSVDVEMRRTPIALEEMTITGDRGVQRVLDVPVAVHLVSTESIRDRPSVSALDHVRAAPGLDIATHGVQSGSVVARGFGNIFSGSLHMLTDHRIAGVPSLRVNLMHMIPATNEDIERIEVVLGPGSALYGPNTENGVLHVLTQSPFTSQGTVVSVSGGEQDMRGATVRTAHQLGDALGLKVSGDYLRAREWEHVDPRESVARDFDVRRWSGEARLDWRVTSSLTSVFSMGRSHLGRGIELTGIGAAQVRDWANTYYQARASVGELFGQVYLNTSDAGETFLLTTGEPIVDRSQLLVAQLQHGFGLGERQRFTYGADYLHTRPNTEGTIHGRYEADDDVREIGAYVQSQTAITPGLDLVAALRVDDHDRLDRPVVSPRAAIVFKPTAEQAVRLTYNRAFSTPRSLDLFLDIDAGAFPNAALSALGYGLRAQGAGGTGFTFQREDGSYVMRSPFAPLGSQPGAPSQVLSADVPVMWDLAVGAMHAAGAFGAPGSPQADGTRDFLRSLAPANDDITRLTRDVVSGQIGALDALGVDDIPVLKPTYTTTFEIGYKGMLGRKLMLAADVWHSTRQDFISALRPVTPLLLLEETSIETFLVSRGMSQAQADAIAAGMAQIPVGVVTDDDISSNPARADFLVTYRNFGRLNLWGSDLSATVLLTDSWSVSGNASWVNQDVFETEQQLITLNAPTLKLSTALGYRAQRGAHGELRVRHHGDFPVLSAPYFATSCIPDSELPAGWTRSGLEEACVESATLVDLTLGYRFRDVRGTAVQLAVQNVFDHGYRSFPGTPEIGRMAVLRLRHEF